MKKFLSKLPVMITFIAVAVIVLAIYIGMLARPISYGMAYTGSFNDGSTQVEATYKFKNNKIVTVKGDMGGIEGTIDFWFIRSGNKIVLVGPVAKNDEQAGMGFMTEAGFKEAVAEFNSADKAEKEALLNEEGVEINAFRLKAPTNETATCVGAIVFASIVGVIELAFITFAVLSTVFFILSKKSKTNSQAEEQVA